MANRSKRQKLTKLLQTLIESVISHRGQAWQKVAFPISSQVPLTTQPPFQCPKCFTWGWRPGKLICPVNRAPASGADNVLLR